jgi:hypothetical protein
MLVGTDVAPTNYTWPDGEQYKKMVNTEKDFLNDLTPALKSIGGVVRESFLSGSTIGNLIVTGIMDSPVMNIMNTIKKVRESKSEYANIEIYLHR